MVTKKSTKSVSLATKNVKRRFKNDNNKKEIIPKRNTKNKNRSKVRAKSKIVKKPIGEFIKTDDKSEFKCDMCNAIFDQKSTFTQHIRSHIYVKSYQCSVCTKSFKTSSHMRRHERTHSDEKPHRCIYCDSAFRERSILKIHMRAHTGEKPYKCDICSKAFSQRASVKVHERIHNGEKPFKCDQCDRAFAERSNLVAHKRIHTGEKPYKCQFCDRRFVRKLSLKMHEVTHYDEKAYLCEFCNKAFYHFKNLEMHVRIHSTNSHKCDICNKEFKLKHYLAKHKRLHTGEKPYECSYCDSAFLYQTSLMSHVRGHYKLKPFKCEICNRSFAESQALKKHHRTHSDERPFECDICKKTFKNKEYFRIHLMLHSGERKYKCEICNRAFVQSTTYKAHLRTHTSERPYECSVCHKQYREKSQLNVHMIIHSGEKFVCDVCKTEFPHKYYLAAHVRKHHSPRRCEFCNKILKNYQSYKKHLSAVHPEKKVRNTWTKKKNRTTNKKLNDSHSCESCGEKFELSAELEKHKETHEIDTKPTIKTELKLKNENATSGSTFNKKTEHINSVDLKNKTTRAQNSRANKKRKISFIRDLKITSKKSSNNDHKPNLVSEDLKPAKKPKRISLITLKDKTKRQVVSNKPHIKISNDIMFSRKKHETIASKPNEKDNISVDFKTIKRGQKNVRNLEKSTLKESVRNKVTTESAVKPVSCFGDQKNRNINKSTSKNVQSVKSLNVNVKRKVKTIGKSPSKTSTIAKNSNANSDILEDLKIINMARANNISSKIKTSTPTKLKMSNSSESSDMKNGKEISSKRNFLRVKKVDELNTAKSISEISTVRFSKRLKTLNSEERKINESNLDGESSTQVSPSINIKRTLSRDFSLPSDVTISKIPTSSKSEISSSPRSPAKVVLTEVSRVSLNSPRSTKTFPIPATTLHLPKKVKFQQSQISTASKDACVSHTSEIATSLVPSPHIKKTSTAQIISDVTTSELSTISIPPKAINISYELPAFGDEKILEVSTDNVQTFKNSIGQLTITPEVANILEVTTSTDSTVSKLSKTPASRRDSTLITENDSGKIISSLTSVENEDVHVDGINENNFDVNTTQVPATDNLLVTQPIPITCKILAPADFQQITTSQTQRSFLQMLNILPLKAPKAQNISQISNTFTNEKFTKHVIIKDARISGTIPKELKLSKSEIDKLVFNKNKSKQKFVIINNINELKSISHVSAGLGDQSVTNINKPKILIKSPRELKIIGNVSTNFNVDNIFEKLSDLPEINISSIPNQLRNIEDLTVEQPLSNPDSNLCEICKKEFSTEKELQCHEQTHTKEELLNFISLVRKNSRHSI